MNEIRIINGWTRDLGIPAEMLESCKAGVWELYNAARPFPAHHTAQGEFIHGVFYGAIDPLADCADEYRKRAGELDASRMVFVEQDIVEQWGRVYCEEHRVAYDSYDFSVIAKSYLRHAKKESL